MKFGFTPTEGGARYADSLEEVRLGEQAGFDSVWLEEHHLERQHYWGTPLVGLAGFATSIPRITLGTDVVVLPFYHPLRLAEEAHMLSIMSNGRFVLGVGMGYREDEYRAYGVPVEGRGTRYGEEIHLLERLLHEEGVTFEGRHHQVSDVTVQPRWSGRIPLWAGGWGELNLRRAAKHADEWIPGPTANLERLLSCRETYERYRAEAGKPAPSDEAPLTRELVIADTDGQAREDAERYLMPNYRDEYGGGWGHPLISAEGARVSDLDAMAADRFIIGGPDTVIEQVRYYAERFGAKHIIFRLSSATTTHGFVMRELELLGERVLPAFRA